MAEARAPNHTPTAFLLLVAGIVIMALAAVATAPMWRQATPEILVPPRTTIALLFQPESSGGLIVRKAPGGEIIDNLGADESGFVRTMARVIRRDLGGATNIIAMPFELNAWQDGRLVLIDTASGRSVDLRAFGPTQAGVFLRWINAEEARR